MNRTLSRGLVVVGLAVTGYATALAWADGAAAWAALQRLGLGTALGVTALCLLNYLLRGLRWRRWMAAQGRDFGLAEGLRLYVAGYALTPTPGSVGEAARGLWLAERPLDAPRALAVFGAERLADLAALGLIALPALGWLLLAHPALGWIATLLAGVAGLAAWVLRSRWRARLGWLQAASRCLAERPLGWLVPTLAAWAAQGLAVALLCRQLGIDIGTLDAAAAYAAAMIGGALSTLPAGLGGTELGLVALLAAQGASSAQAVAATLLARLFTLWLAVALGALALLYSAFAVRDIRLA